jgi:hypothetical protein
MRSPTDLSRLIKFLTRDHWKALFDEVLGQHFGPVMREFDLREQHVQGQAAHRGRAYRRRRSCDPSICTLIAPSSVSAFPTCAGGSTITIAPRRHSKTRTERARATVLVHVEFREDEAAEAFERDFEAYTDA